VGIREISGFMQNKNNKAIIIWLLTGCFLIYAMVVIGGITRLTHSGLSMVEWTLFGSTPPSSEEKWNELFDHYKQYPEYQQINFNFSIDEFKSIFWWEYMHRFLGRTIGVVFIIPFFYFWFKKMINDELMKKLLLLVILGGLQGLLGWYMVKSGLNKMPSVSHYRLAAHLISAFTVFAFTFWTALGLIYKEKSEARSQKPEDLNQSQISELKSQISLKRLSIFFFIIVIIQITYGAFVAGLKAGHICPTWPKMCDDWMPDAVTALQPTWRNFLEGQAGVQFVHRCIAVIVVLMLGVIHYKGFRSKQLNTLQKRILMGLGLIVVLQFTLGVFTLVYNVPVTLGVLHQTGAFFLFATSLWLIHSLQTD